MCLQWKEKNIFCFSFLQILEETFLPTLGTPGTPLYKGTNRLFHPHSIFRNEGKEVAQSVWMGDWGVWVEQCHVFLSIRWRTQIMEIINLDQKCRRWKAKTCASRCGRCWKLKAYHCFFMRCYSVRIYGSRWRVQLNIFKDNVSYFVIGM